MTAKYFRPALGILLALFFVAAPSWAGERIKTDGTSKDSPIKVSDLTFQDSGYGLPGPNAEIRTSVTVRNTSKEDDLKNVSIKLQLSLPGGDIVQEWTKTMPVMKKGAVVEFDPGAVYYNYSFNNLQAGVEIEHDKPEEKKDEKEEK
jgi:hypothetical protein